jgi:NitT/TauT family transport system substrate-binding protein
MSCCDESSARVPDRSVSRRALLKGAAVVSAVVPGLHGSGAQAQGKKVTLAFCSQLLCIIPYEVARAGGHFQARGLNVELVYTRGGNAAMQALVGGAVDYAATALDVAIQAYAKGADIRRFATTGRLPLFALATAPKTAAQIATVKDLEGKTVGVSALGNADHALLLFLLKKANADAGKVQFATLGVNLLEALRQAQVDAGLVQEPALTLLRQSGARVLVNAMDAADAHQYLGGPYEFMGVAVRGKEVEQRRTEMTELAKGLAGGLIALRKMNPEEIAGILPKELTAGMDNRLLGEIVTRYRESLYPETVKIDLASARRVAESLQVGGLLQPGADVSKLHDTSIVGG